MEETPNNSLTLFSPNQQSSENGISIYKSGGLTPEIMKYQFSKIAHCFQKLQKPWFETVKARIIELKFSPERLEAAVNNMIDHCPYPEPGPAVLLDFDKKIELLTLSQLTAKAKVEGQSIMAKYDLVEVDGLKFYALKTYIEKYKLPIPRGSSYKPRERTPDLSAEEREGWKNVFKEFK
jgi:hypothetical protein